MKEKLMNNWTLKIGSILFAVLMWLVVINLNDPYVSKTISVPIQFVNEDVLTNKSKTYTPEINTVTVRYEFRKLSSVNVTEDDFLVTADLNQIYEDTGQVPLTLKYVGEDENVVRKSELGKLSVQVVVEKIEPADFTLEINQIGDLPIQYTIGGYTFAPSSVKVTAPESILAQIYFAGVDVDLTNVEDSIQGVDVAVKLYKRTSSGENQAFTDEEMEKVTISQPKVDYTVYIITSDTVSIRLSDKVTGEVADGYWLSKATTNPTEIKITGTKQDMLEQKAITIPSEALNVEGRSETFTIEYDITNYLAEGVSVAKDGDEIVTITFKIEQMETDNREVNKSDITLIGQNSSYEYSFSGESTFMIPVRGIELKQLDIAQINMSLDVTGLGPGTHNLLLSVDMPDGYTYTGNRRISIVITDPRDTSANEGDAATTEENTTQEESSSQSAEDSVNDT